MKIAGKVFLSITHTHTHSSLTNELAGKVSFGVHIIHYKPNGNIKIKVREMVNGGNKVEKISNIRYKLRFTYCSGVCEHLSHAQFDLI